jgi:ribosomal protein S18 acetylase RimI-like enzyme
MIDESAVESSPALLVPRWIDMVNIRQVKRADLPALEWDGEYAHFQSLYAEIFESADHGQAVMWVAEIEKIGLIGQVFVQFNSSRVELADGYERAYIYGFRIKPAYRRRGLGTRMMAVVERDLIERGFKFASLNVAQINTDARRLYENLGYHVVGTDPGKWHYLDQHGIRRDVHEPAWRMVKKLKSY